MYRFVLTVTCLLLSFTLFSQEFIKRNGKKLMLGTSNTEVHLRGVCFGNEVWSNNALPTNTHNEDDFKRVEDMGMNAIRFYMNYLTFEDDANPYVYKNAGWTYLDTNIAWARRHNIYLILNIHVPQGGFQSMCQGTQLWQNKENQNRLTALWHAIASRYANETQIAGFDLLNEPIPTDSIEQWNDLAKRLIDTIRTVDNNHVVIVENAIALNCDYGYANATDNFPVLSEKNLMYTSHFYEPYSYTTQLQSWAGTGDGGKYPDETIISPPADLTWTVGQYNNPELPSGTSGWTYYQGQPYTVTDSTLILGRPVFTGNYLGSGVAYFDEITINEVDNNGQIINQIATFNYTTSTNNYWYWSQNNDGSLGSANSGSHDNASITITGSTGYANVTDPTIQFKVEKGKRYVISGWMKGDNIPSNANAYIGFGFYKSPSSTPLYYRDYNFLKAMVISYSKYPAMENYPLYFGEFGVVRDAFANGKGGELWVQDMLHIFDSLGYNWTYHDYREDGFGIYAGTSGLVDTTTGTTSLINVFRKFFGLAVTEVTPYVFKNNLGVLVYPNPTHDVFDLDLSAISGSIDIIITDLLGRELFRKKYSKGKDFKLGENLDLGNYLLIISTDKGSFTYKICKQ